jgi:hypothetical protein
MSEPRPIHSIEVDEVRAACQGLIFAGLIDKRREVSADSSINMRSQERG